DIAILERSGLLQNGEVDDKIAKSHSNTRRAAGTRSEDAVWEVLNGKVGRFGDFDEGSGHTLHVRVKSILRPRDPRPARRSCSFRRIVHSRCEHVRSRRGGPKAPARKTHLARIG